MVRTIAAEAGKPLYDARGALRFRGGVTGSRGHEGDGPTDAQPLAFARRKLSRVGILLHGRSFQCGFEFSDARHHIDGGVVLFRNFLTNAPLKRRSAFRDCRVTLAAWNESFTFQGYIDRGFRLPIPPLPHERIDGGADAVVVIGPDAVRRREAALTVIGGGRLLVVPMPTNALEWEACIREATLLNAVAYIEIDGSLADIARRWIDRASHLRIVVASKRPVPADEMPRRRFLEIEAGKGA